VIAADCALRFIEADLVQEMTRSYFRCKLDDAQASRLPSPGGPPMYRADALADSGNTLHYVLGRLLRRPHWIREAR
jgi:hypothetical protein